MSMPTTQPLRHSPDRRPGIVVDAASVPAWVLRWSERSGRTVRTRPAEATADAARTGDSVLVLRAPTLALERPRIVAALGGLPEDAAVLADALDAALHLDGGLTVVHGVPVSFGERSVGLDEALRRGEDLLHDARALVDAAAVRVPVGTRLVRAWPHELVGELLDADLLVIGGPHTGTEGGVGLITATAVRHAPCAVLLTPRPALIRSDLRAEPMRPWETRWLPTPRVSSESAGVGVDR